MQVIFNQFFCRMDHWVPFSTSTSSTVEKILALVCPGILPRSTHSSPPRNPPVCPSARSLHFKKRKDTPQLLRKKVYGVDVQTKKLTSSERQYAFLASPFVGASHQLSVPSLLICYYNEAIILLNKIENNKYTP